MVEKSNGLNKQCLTHVLGSLKLLISAFKVGEFYDLVTVFEKHCCLSARIESLQGKENRTYAESIDFFCFDKLNKVATTNFHVVKTVE